MEERKKADFLLEAIQNEEDSSKGVLKIFFGYAAGVGKTYSMLEAAHEAKERGVDVVLGYIEPHARPATAALMKGLETLSVQTIEYNNITLREFDLDAALKRKPQLICVDELAHTNAQGCRHTKRYQDIKELLSAGIDVYTTVNVQHLESLNDTVASITGIMVQERIPDSVFDEAAQVELVDIEPKELIERLNTGKVYRDDQAKRATSNFFTVDNLTALREIALRRCADRVNHLTEKMRVQRGGVYHTEEHILVCLSAAPSNAKIVRTAARMASAFRGHFTAIYVEGPDYSLMDEADKDQLRKNARLAQQLGAKVETVYGDDVPYQIAEFARLSNVSKIVVGRSTAKPGILKKMTFTERLILIAPDLDVYIIPDATQKEIHKGDFSHIKGESIFSFSDFVKCLTALGTATVLGLILWHFNLGVENIIAVYILGVIIAAIVMRNKIYGFLTSIISVLIFNFFFTEPRYSFQVNNPDYWITFFIMFTIAVLSSNIAGKLRRNAKQFARAAYRTKILFDTNQQLQMTKDREEIVMVTAGQLSKLLNRNIIAYLSEDGNLGKAHLCPIEGEEIPPKTYNMNERAVASWVLKNNKHAGATTETLSSAKCLYLAIRVNDNVYGVVGIVMKEDPIDAFENSILLSILGECALALENEKNQREKEEAAVMAKNEQLRANLLRSISHDLRTPLTSISGHADNLLSNEGGFDENTRKKMYTDIYNDSQWLINLVENLLSVTRLKEGEIKLNCTTELLEDIIDEALSHVNRRKEEHEISVQLPKEMLFVKSDSKLIVQVFINIIDNAIKYTQKGSHIVVKAKDTPKWIEVSIADDGPGISREAKENIFKMFYTGSHKVADSRRSLGLGLSLCKTIVDAHGGELIVRDNEPQGTVFVFTLPKGEVDIHG